MEVAVSFRIISHPLQVRGTPGSGKSTLADLLEQYIKDHEPRTKVIIIRRYPSGAQLMGGWMSYLKKKGWVLNNKTVLVFDEAQVSYHDMELWHIIKSVEDYPQRRIILFVSYGSAKSKLAISGALVVIPDAQRVTLTAVDHDDDLPSAGLLFSRAEINELVLIKYPPSHFSFEPAFFDTLFDVCDGHIGAFCDFISVICTQTVSFLC